MGGARDNGSSVAAASMPDSAGFLLARIGLVVARRFAARLGPLGLEPRQVGLLRAVADAEGQSQQALGERLRIPPSRMVALVDELERRDLLERRRNPVDRRAHALHLTDAGRLMLASALDVAGAHEAEVCSTLTGAERDQFVTLLRRVADSLGAGQPGLAQPPVATTPCGDGSDC